MKSISIFDSTLRDGAQSAGISFSVYDKLKIVKYLDELGVDYIEAGNPGSNPKDLEFFEKVKEIHLEKSILTAFGSTRRKGVNVAEDSNVLSLLKADTKAVAIFGKTWDFHATEILHVSLEENLKMIEETVRFLCENNKEVIFDAEHFFDGFKNNQEYALEAIVTAQNAGAKCICLCDTNGGCFPDEIEKIVSKVKEVINVEIGIHAHNDAGTAVANSMSAVFCGATHVQGTLVGFGERCGNANLSTIIANLQLKRDYNCIPKENMELLTSTSLKISEVANMTLDNQMPYVGANAFAHKAGMHIDGVTKSSTSFEHVAPKSVGNERRFLMSEVAGRSTLVEKIKKIDASIDKDDPVTTVIINRVKELEHQGYQFEGADGTFELLVRKALGTYKPCFELESFKIIEESNNVIREFNSSAMVKLNVDGKVELTVAEGNGPVNALDKALRKALEIFYPCLKEVHLTDYKVRVLETTSATAAQVRVLIESSDLFDSWTTVGVSTDIIEASWIALVDSIEIKLIKELEKHGGIELLD